MANTFDSIVISTGLVDLTSKSVLENVLGQLSDGMWENSRAMEHYWPYAEVEMIDGKVCILISRYSNCSPSHCGDHPLNHFRYKMNLDSVLIKKWFAGKIKAIIRQEAKDYPNRGLTCSLKCDVPLYYMYHHYDRDAKITAADAYKVAKALEK